MRSKEFVFESKTIKSEKPRNFVAKNAKMGGAGAHKDKKKAVKQGDVKHKKKEIDTMEANDVSKIKQLETLISELEKLMPAVTEAQKNHYVFEEMESEIRAIAEASKGLSDSSATTDITDAVEEAVQHMRQANGAIYEIEKTLKGLIKSANYWLEDAREEEQYEERFGPKEDSLEETEKKKGADGKACWDGYRYAGTENGKDKCVPVKKKK